ncbi:hypothetical protein BDY24DRAFT_92252 [Mrakia frigida]|uniref:zinc finger MYND domain-containing protein n=1 Tax=Mrakia frigida TaxID=29902 RepID=UPI003FCC1A49
MRTSDFNNWLLRNRDIILLDVFAYLLVNVPHQHLLSLNLFSSSNEPAFRQTINFLDATHAYAKKNQHDDSAQFAIESVQDVIDFFKSRGRVETHPQYQGEDWKRCAGGGLYACDEERAEKLGACARCRSVMYCGPVHQKAHWKGKGTVPMTWTHKELCFEPGF